MSKNKKEVMAVQNPEQQKIDSIVVNLVEVVNMACLGSGNHADAINRRMMVGVNLVAGALNQISENSKASTLNTVINTLVLSSGLKWDNSKGCYAVK